MGGGQPDRVAVQGICLISGLVCAWAVSRLVHRVDQRAAGLAACLVLMMPLLNGLWRHFMPEGPLVAIVALSVLMAVRAAERPSWQRALQLGVVLGLGLLIKQTFLLCAFFPVLWAGRAQGRWWGLSACAVVLVAGPWYGRHLADQVAYTTASSGIDAAPSLGVVLAYYPLVLITLGLGVPLSVALIAGLWRNRGRTWVLPAIWLLGGLLLLVIVPKKYPRLIAPLLPAVALGLSGIMVL